MWLERVMGGPGRQAAEALAAEDEPEMAAEQISSMKRRWGRDMQVKERALGIRCRGRQYCLRLGYRTC